MEKAKYNQTCNLGCERNNPQRRGTGEIMNENQIKIELQNKRTGGYNGNK